MLLYEIDFILYINIGHINSVRVNNNIRFDWEEKYIEIYGMVAPTINADRNPPDVIIPNSLFACLLSKHSLKTSQNIIAINAICNSTKI